MGREVKLNGVGDALEPLDYPTDRSSAANAVSDVTLILADGEVALGDVIRKTGSERFESASDLESELHNALPREAVGEPYQSEGDA
jgi:hypothetical protein